jgi:hypothetical protein
VTTLSERRVRRSCVSGEKGNSESSAGVLAPKNLRALCAFV